MCLDLNHLRGFVSACVVGRIGDVVWRCLLARRGDCHCSDLKTQFLKTICAHFVIGAFPRDIGNFPGIRKVSRGECPNGLSALLFANRAKTRLSILAPLSKMAKEGLRRERFGTGAPREKAGFSWTPPQSERFQIDPSRFETHD